MTWFSSKLHCQSTDSRVNALMAINESHYIGKPLDSIIAVLPAGYIEMKIIASTHRYTARKIRVKYANEVWIELHVREFTHMNPRDENRIWNITLMRKEKLYKTVIYKHTECFRNCDVR